MSVQRASQGSSAEGLSVQSGDLRNLDKIPNDAIGIFCFSDVRPLAGSAGYIDWRISGALSRSLQSKSFAAARGEIMLLPVKARARFRRLFVFGLGPLATCDAAAYRDGCLLAVSVMKKAGVREIILAAPAAAKAPQAQQEFIRTAGVCVRGDVAMVLVDPDTLA